MTKCTPSGRAIATSPLSNPPLVWWLYVTDTSMLSKNNTFYHCVQHIVYTSKNPKVGIFFIL